MKRQTEVMGQTRRIVEGYGELRCSIERRKNGHHAVTIENTETGHHRTIICATTSRSTRGDSNHYARVRRACRELGGNG